MELSMDMVKAAVREVLDETMGVEDYRISLRWQGGKLLIQPFDSSQKPKEILINIFFKKVTAVRERLRVLEQKVNNHERLTQEDKLEFQQLVTRAYGSLTAFNFLFRDESDKFSGMKE